MCVSQRRWTGYRGPCSPTLPLIFLLLLPLSFLSSTPPFAQGAIQIPENYKVKNMSQPPVLKETPISYTAFSQEDINLPCEASGTPKPTYRWMKDGLVFGSERNNSGTLVAEGEGLLTQYEGYYRCYASNMLGTAVTQTVRVIVEPQPVLQKQQKRKLQAHVGESIMLSCNPPKSSTPPHIHWMDKKMVHIMQSDRVMVGLDGNLYFSNLKMTDSRDDYICNAQYTAARTVLPDTAVTLTVTSSNDVPHSRKPHLFRPTSTHSPVLALSGHSVTLECIPGGLPTPRVEWKKKDGRLDETSGKLERHNRWLQFDSITQEDDGEYECIASNGHGSISSSFTVTVEAAPYWVKEPQNLLYAPGETVRLDCQAEGIPTPTVIWSINGQPVAEVDDDPRRSVSGGVFILRDVEFADTAVYQCEATNKHGSILLNTYLYVIELPPQILSSDGVVAKVTEGGTVSLDCESFGSPRPHVTWEGEDKLSLLSETRVSLLTNGTIKLTDVSHSDSGEYTCSIKHTNISITAYLEVYNRTLIVTSPQHLRVATGHSALLDCRFSKDPRLPEPQIIWRKDGQKLQESSPDDKYTFFDNGTLKVTDVHSRDNAAYSCQVITELDNVVASGSITVLARPDPPKDLTFSDVEDYSLTLTWVPGHSHNSPIEEFIVEAHIQHQSEETDGEWVEWSKMSGLVNHLKMELNPYYRYRFRVIAVNQMGKSNPSQPSEEYTTLPAVPYSNPSRVRSESIDPNTLVITWDEMDKRSHNGQGFMYKVSWQKVGDGPNWNSETVKSPPFFVNNTGTYTPFMIKVQAVNTLGFGPEPDTGTGYSGEDKPEEAPTGVATIVMNSTVRVKWNAAQNVRGLLKGYKLYIKRLGPREVRGRRSLGKRHHKEERLERGKDDGERRVVVVSSTKTSEDVTGLQLYSRYTVSITAFNSKGEGPHSPPHHFNTPEGVPGKPASLTFESPSEKSLNLYWTPPLEPNGILTGYVVQYQKDVMSSPLQMEIISDPSVTHIELDALDPSTYYIFSVIARTAAGDGLPITERNATLLEGVPPSNITINSSNTALNLSWVPGERDRNHAFKIHYRRKIAGSEWEKSEVLNSTQGFYSLSGLQPGTFYHLKIMQGNSTHWEEWAETTGPVPTAMSSGFATQGWLIGLISAIVLLVLILLILCLIKRSKGGKYAVKDKEDKEVDSEARPMKDETFGEYSDADEKRSDSQPSLCGESKLGSDDSLAEYGDSVDIQFNEDGSFIGQYSNRGPAPPGNESSGPASPVNAVPPPPIAPSMSSILNRPS
ncbi:neural cell adhesion molecule L1.1 isoform X2 [Dicentrarchus labrax]|uniref:Neural cell adhesion molecule L1 n=1 Tax=Dicentrarchus labrax TaxID=13489 RepID=A0A8C4IE32_DICLA|nr:neural cell adhesion molecule L1.1 isoform X2 [Dicentrarchus labrax]